MVTLNALHCSEWCNIWTFEISFDPDTLFFSTVAWLTTASMCSVFFMILQPSEVTHWRGQRHQHWHTCSTRPASIKYGLFHLVDTSFIHFFIGPPICSWTCASFSLAVVLLLKYVPCSKVCAFIMCQIRICDQTSRFLCYGQLLHHVFFSCLAHILSLTDVHSVFFSLLT